MALKKFYQGLASIVLGTSIALSGCSSQNTRDYEKQRASQQKTIEQLKSAVYLLEKQLKHRDLETLEIYLDIIRNSPDVELVLLKGTSKEISSKSKDFYETAEKYSIRELAEKIDFSKENHAPWALLVDINRDGAKDIVGNRDYVGDSDTDTTDVVKYGKSDGTFSSAQNLPEEAYKRILLEK